MTSPGKSNGVLVGYSFIKDQSHPPFDQEISGGAGIVIHDKFIVVDFNSNSPSLITGSSNLANEGETRNGDNLIHIQDPNLAILYAVEATRLIDHFRFSAILMSSTKNQPLLLSKGPWYQPYYLATDEHYKERLIYS